jgi:hypothetical protein
MFVKPFICRLMLVFGASALVLEATGTTSCDVNNDGAVNVVDVQLMVNMQLAVTPCAANLGGVLGCDDTARQVVIKAALGQGCHFNTLSWVPSSSSGVIGYNIYRGTTPGGESKTPLNTNGPVTGASFTDTNTVSGTTYYYTITATDGSNESAPSSETSVTAQ